MDTDLWALERRFWLEGVAVYEAHLAPDARLVFPWPTGVLEREAVLDALRGAPRWQSVVFDARQVLALGDDGVLLLYAARARQHAEDEAYEALCTSAYRRVDEAWHLVLHHQTPNDRSDITIESVDTTL